MAPEGTVILLCIQGAPAPCLPFLPSAAKQLSALGLPRGGDGEYTTFRTTLSTPKASFFLFFLNFNQNCIQNDKNCFLCRLVRSWTYLNHAVSLYAAHFYCERNFIS